MFYSIAAHAHDCSGGAGGGMDATGNQCNAEFVSTDVAMTEPAVTSQASPSPSANDAHSRHVMVNSKTHAKKSARQARSKQPARQLT
jgi:hypothetical protein